MHAESPAAARRRVYKRAVSPRLRRLLHAVLAMFAVLGATTAYLAAVTATEWATGKTYQNYAYQIVFLVHLGLAFVVPVDLDGDGPVDLIVANDTVRNFLFRNLGDGTFEEIGAVAGVGYDSAGAATGAMGTDVADYRNDGRLGIAIGNFANEMSSLYVQQTDALQFADEAIVEGVGAPSRAALSFGLFFFDVDLDGRLDLLQANGHIEDDIARVQASQSHAQPAQLFWNTGPDARMSFTPMPADSIGDLARPIVGRGAAFADIDGDGDLDVLLTQVGGRPMLLRNDQALGHHWVRVRVVGDDHAGDRDAIGSLTVSWPDGTVEDVTSRFALDATVVIER